jgi:hypothetical protein
MPLPAVTADRHDVIGNAEAARARHERGDILRAKMTTRSLARKLESLGDAFQNSGDCRAT